MMEIFVKIKFRICAEFLVGIFLWLKINSRFYVFPGRGGSAGGKFRISLACPVGAVMNCADNTGKFKIKCFNESKSNLNNKSLLQVVRTCTLLLSMESVVV